MGSFSWIANTDPEDKSGTAEYIRGRMIISFKLESFELASELDKFIDAQYRLGYRNALENVLYSMKSKVDNLPD